MPCSKPLRPTRRGRSASCFYACDKVLHPLEIFRRKIAHQINKFSIQLIAIGDGLIFCGLGDIASPEEIVGGDIKICGEGYQAIIIDTPVSVFPITNGVLRGIKQLAKFQLSKPLTFPQLLQSVHLITNHIISQLEILYNEYLKKG